MIVKVCGVRSVDAAQACAAGGVDLVGLNFVPGAGRAVSERLAVAMKPSLSGCKTVGVFRDQPLEEVAGIVARVGLDMAQLHGDESPAMCAELAQQVPVVKAIDLQKARNDGLCAAYARSIAMFVVDGREPGSGRVWDFGALSLRNGRLHGVPVLLAGGLNPENVAAAIVAVRPAGVDCASGVEDVEPSTGERVVSAERVVAFAATAKEAWRRL